MTVHKAKGLEFPVVYLPGLVSGRFPATGRREPLGLPLALVNETLPEGDYQLQEERRLFYVGMTRARDELVLSHAADYGGQRARRVSPFVLEALDLPVAAGAAGAGAKVSSPLERMASLERTDASPSAPTERSGEPLMLSFYAIDDYLTCPLKYKFAHLLRVPLAPHHSIIYGAALHAAVSEFHKRHARGDVMSEEALVEAFAAAWRNEGFLSREHEEARLAAGRAALRRFREEQLAPGAVIPAYVERDFSFLLDGDRVRGRYDRVDIVPREPGDPEPGAPGEGEASGAGPASGADVVEPTLGLAARAGRHHGLQVVRRAGPGEGPPAREGLAPALDLRDGLRGDDGSPARTRSPFTSWSPGWWARRPWSASGSRRRASPIRAAAAGIRARDFGAKPDHLACSYCAFREICPASARSAEPWRRWRPKLAPRSTAVLAGAGRAPSSRPTTSTSLAAIPDGVVDLVYADPPFATGDVQRLASIRTGAGERTRRGFGGREVA